MRITPIGQSTPFVSRKSLSFQGVTTDYQITKGKGDLKNNSYWHKNSSVEEAVGAFHKNYTGKAYFANPMEHVSDRIKDKVDYVVYDNEPKYPAIEEFKENYLGNLRKNLRDDIEEVREYYYRREMGGFANVEEAKYKQQVAAEVTGFYDRAGDARYRKESLEDSIKNINQNINSKEREINLLNTKIQEKTSEKNIWETKYANYMSKDEKYGELQKLAEQTIEKDTEEVNFISKQIKKMQTSLEKCRIGINKCINEIENAKINIGVKKAEIAELDKERNIKSRTLNSIIEKELKPMFKALKEFYKQHGIKGLRG